VSEDNPERRAVGDPSWCTKTDGYLTSTCPDPHRRDLDVLYAELQLIVDANVGWAVDRTHRHRWQRTERLSHALCLASAANGHARREAEPLAIHGRQPGHFQRFDVGDVGAQIGASAELCCGGT
jgi:hypothetical protein